MGSVCSGPRYPHDACEYNNNPNTKLKLVRDLFDFSLDSYSSDVPIIYLALLMVLVLVVIAVIYLKILRNARVRIGTNSTKVRCEEREVCDMEQGNNHADD